jgi:hypothetical protein
VIAIGGAEFVQDERLERRTCDLFDASSGPFGRSARNTPASQK